MLDNKKIYVIIKLNLLTYHLSVLIDFIKKIVLKVEFLIIQIIFLDFVIQTNHLLCDLETILQNIDKKKMISPSRHWNRSRHILQASKGLIIKWQFGV